MTNPDPLDDRLERVEKADMVIYWSIKHQRLVSISRDDFSVLKKIKCQLCIPIYKFRRAEQKLCISEFSKLSAFKKHILHAENVWKRELSWSEESEIPFDLEREREIGDLSSLDNEEIIKIEFINQTFICYRDRILPYFKKNSCLCTQFFENRKCPVQIGFSFCHFFSHMSFLEKALGRYMVFKGNPNELVKDGQQMSYLLKPNENSLTADEMNKIDLTSLIKKKGRPSKIASIFSSNQSSEVFDKLFKKKVGRPRKNPRSSYFKRIKNAVNLTRSIKINSTGLVNSNGSINSTGLVNSTGLINSTKSVASSTITSSSDSTKYALTTSHQDSPSNINKPSSNCPSPNDSCESFNSMIDSLLEQNLMRSVRTTKGINVDKNANSSFNQDIDDDSMSVDENKISTFEIDKIEESLKRINSSEDEAEESATCTVSPENPANPSSNSKKDNDKVEYKVENQEEEEINKIMNTCFVKKNKPVDISLNFDSVVNKRIANNQEIKTKFHETALLTEVNKPSDDGDCIVLD